MAKLNIFYITKDTVGDMERIDEAIRHACECNGGVVTGSGMGPEGRDISVDIFPDTEVPRVISALSKVHDRILPKPEKFKVDVHIR